MKITSADIKKHEFEKSFRGYNVDEVNHFLSSLAQEWDKMLNETKMLKMQLEISEKEASKLKEVESTLMKTLKTAEDTSNNIRESAQFEATKRLDEANYQAQRTLTEANNQANSTISNANLEASRTIENANLEASKTIENANNLAAKTVEEANETASKTVNEANNFANTTIEQTNLSAKQILTEAENKKSQVIKEANAQVNAIQNAGHQEFTRLENEYNALSSRKNELIARLKAYQTEIGNLVEGNYKFESHIQAVNKNAFAEIVSEKAPVYQEINPIIEEIEPVSAIETEISEIEAPFFEREIIEEDIALPEMTIPEIIVETSLEEEEEDFAMSLPSAVNDINVESREDENTNLELIEGIGPKIKEVLFNAGIKDFRSLAITPEYRLKDILSAAGPHFAAHDPSTWNEQAMLASKGQWTELEELKNKLIAGRAPKEEIVTSAASQVSTDGSNTEDMLDKVNKVKAAIRKAMVESTNAEKPKAPESKPEGGSFFDRI